MRSRCDPPTGGPTTRCQGHGDPALSTVPGLFAYWRQTTRMFSARGVLAPGDVELHVLAVLQFAVALTGGVRVAGEDIRTAALLRMKPKPFSASNPFAVPLERWCAPPKCVPSWSSGRTSRAVAPHVCVARSMTMFRSPTRQWTRPSPDRSGVCPPHGRTAAEGSDRTVTALAMPVGVLGAIHGIGGGSSSDRSSSARACASPVPSRPRSPPPSRPPLSVPPFALLSLTGRGTSHRTGTWVGPAASAGSSAPDSSPSSRAPHCASCWARRPPVSALPAPSRPSPEQGPGERPAMRAWAPALWADWLCQFLWESFHGDFGSHSAGFSVINNSEF